MFERDRRDNSSVAAVLIGICFYGLSLACWSQEVPPLGKLAGVIDAQDKNLVDSESCGARAAQAVILAQASVKNGPQSAQKRKLETSEDVQRAAEETLQKFPTQKQINTIKKKSDRAFLDNHAASIYYDRLPRIPGGRASASDTATVLGCVIAHELGHLLLGSHGHTVDGIMKGQWDTGQTELALRLQLRFLQQEAERMRAVLRKEVARIETVAASHAPQP